MRKFKFYKSGKDINIKLDINQLIDEDHLCRFIEHIVSTTLDTSRIELKL